MPISNADSASSLYPILSAFLSNLSNKTSLPIVHTNAIPDEALASSIADDLHKSRIELSEIDLEIYEGERRLKWLREWRKRCRDAIRRHEAVLSPIRRLPVEVISQIMLFALAISRPSFREDGWPINRHDCAKNEWGVPSLALVCTDWREAAITCPRIWSHIMFCPKYSTSEMLQIYISRAGSVPLTFTRCEPYAHYDHTDTHHEIEDLSKAQIMSASSSSTWTSASLYINIHDTNSMEYAFRLKGKLQSLRHLKLRITSRYNADGELSIFAQSNIGWSLVHDLLEDVHSLVDLELSGSPNNFDSRNVIISSLRSLRNLTLCLATGWRNIPNDLGPVLASCSSLESLTLGDGFDIQRLVCLPSLRDLTLLFNLYSNTIMQASNLRLPSLESLSLVHFSDQCLQFVAEAPFTRWCSENLRRLIIIHPIPHWLASTEDTFLSLVKQLPEIDTLQFVSYSGCLIPEMTIQTRISFPEILSYFDFMEYELLPRLKNLMFKVYYNRWGHEDYLELPGPIFFNVLKSRGYGNLLGRVLNETSNDDVKEDGPPSHTAPSRLETFSWISDIPLGIRRDDLSVLDAYVQSGLCYESRVMMYY
jgi:hypothetical protein